MAICHEVILIGLGKFGKTVSNNLNQRIEERKIQLGDLANNMNLHTIIFSAETVFHSTDYMNEIVEKVKDSDAFQKGQKFSFIFVGDFYEEFTSKYAVDFAYLPYLLENTGVLNHDDIIGFFTFASALRVVENVPEEKIALICKYFERLEDVNQKDIYTPPFKMLGDKDFKSVQTTSGPFNRNYLLVTPGKSDVVERETGIVFAERIFYELFYLSKTFKEKESGFIAEKAAPEAADKNLSCFSMVQIPRITEVQKYYLKYLLEEEIFSRFLEEPLKGIDEEFFSAKFMEMIDIPGNSDDFPMERATELFVNRYKENFSRILTYYITGKKQDFKDYIEDVKTRVNQVVFNMYPYYNNFATTELDYINETLKTGFENLFNFDRISGNFKTYKSFIEKLKAKLKTWGNSLLTFSTSEESYDIEKDFDKIEKKVSHLQKMWILSLLPLRPIRQKLIENTILSLPIENYLNSLIKKNLAKAFYDYWKGCIEKEKSPIKNCEQILENLNHLEEKLTEKEKYISDKIQFIENMNNSYYILPMFKQKEDYDNLLSIIKSNNFGSHKEQLKKQIVSTALKLWVKDKDIFNITKNPTDFISFIENDFVPDNMHLFSETENMNEKFFDFSKEAVKKTYEETESINAISFQTKDTALFQNETLLTPSNMKPDCLSEEIDSKLDTSSHDFEKVEIPKDFTLGSVVYFKDYLYMSQKDMKKKDFLENYRNIETSAPEYDNSLTEKVVEENIVSSDSKASENESQEESNTNNQSAQTEMNLWKFSRSVLMFYVENEKVTSLYNKTFGETKENITDDEIENLAKTITFEESLNELSAEKLTEFAKDNNIPVKSDSAKQIKLILHEFSKR